MNISVAQAKAKFSELLKRAEAGEEISVTRHGKVVAKVVPADENLRKPPLLGALRGRVWISGDFDEPLEEFKEYTE